MSRDMIIEEGKRHTPCSLSEGMSWTNTPVYWDFYFIIAGCLRVQGVQPEALSFSTSYLCYAHCWWLHRITIVYILHRSQPMSMAFSSILFCSHDVNNLWDRETARATTGLVQFLSVLFYNYNTEFKTDERTLHAGKPVVKGVKYIITKWLRQKKF